MKLVSGVYLLGMWAYGLCLRLVSPFNIKARQICRGRRETWRKLAEYDKTGGCIWVHAASLGEFEQGRPLIEAIKAQRPEQKIVLTFYSPSGYEVRKNYKMADMVCYLPSDTPRNARRFVDAIGPSAAYFVKYEFWHFYLSALRRHGVPLYGVSMIFRRGQPFFSPWGDWFREMLRSFSHLYVQDAESGRLLHSIGVEAYSVAGDTRFDRVSQIAAGAAEIPAAAALAGGARHVVVAGSTWPPDEDILADYINKAPADVKMIIAPHEIDKGRVGSLCAKLRVPYALYSSHTAEELASARVLVVDTIGILSAVYRYSTLCYVGGGFGVGIHNTLEPAIYGRPVVFGPNHKRFKEAVDLIDRGGGFCVRGSGEFAALTDSLLGSAERLAAAGEAAGAYCRSMLGATEKIIEDTQNTRQKKS